MREIKITFEEARYLEDLLRDLDDENGGEFLVKDQTAAEIYRRLVNVKRRQYG